MFNLNLQDSISQTYIVAQGFFVILAAVFVVNVVILVYFTAIMRVRFIVDICEPLVLFLLGYHSLADNLFSGDAEIRPRKETFSVPWIVKARYGQLVVVGQDEADEKEQSMWRDKFHSKRRRPS
jgi:hypothetical protein